MIKNKGNDTIKQNQINEKEELPLLRRLPSNIQAEQMLLGAILTNNELLSYVAEFLRSEHFFEPIHQKIYEAIEKIIEKGLIATPVTLRSMLTQDELFKEIEQAEYLAKLITMSMMVINPIDYGKIIYDLAIKRNLINIGEEIVNTAYDSTLTQEANTQIEEAENKLYNLANSGVNEKGFTEIEMPAKEALEIINRAIKSDSKVVGISSGFIDLDKLLAGFNNSDLIILAGRPSMGKTAFALNLAFNACKSMEVKNKEQGKKQQTVGFFSLEMSSVQLVTRLFSMKAEIYSHSLRTGELSRERQYELQEQANIISKLPFHIDDSPGLSISTIRMRA
ncbi:MAG TPA: replicative DNA helicase, partial [Rickettsia endosymbiont of Omalisus fontisbellaquei]|nr:replicative DNA helicase [Rickettsia endosymbiont of Omalisus fontisbellaquei]